MPVEVNVGDTPPPGFVDMVEKTVWGTGKGMRYQQLNVKKRVKDLKNPVYITINRFKTILAVVNLSKRFFTYSEQKYQSFYVRYLSFTPGLRTGTGTRKKGKKGGIIRSQLNEVLSSDELVSSGAVYYAYIESGNERSRQFCDSFDFKHIRQFNTHVFSRVNPKISKGARLIENSEIDIIKSILAKNYKGYTFYNQEVFNSENYYVYESNGEITAGLQIIESRWKIQSLPGLSGKILHKSLPFIPYLSRIIDPNNYRFMGADQIFLKENKEDDLEQLMESVCKIRGIYSMICWSDTDSSLNTVMENIDLGLINSLKGSIPSNVITRTEGFSEDLTVRFRNSPAYINPFDLT